MGTPVQAAVLVVAGFAVLIRAQLRLAGVELTRDRLTVSSVATLK